MSTEQNLMRGAFESRYPVPATCHWDGQWGYLGDEQYSRFWDCWQAARRQAVPFQAGVAAWMLECFGQQIARDKTERNHRFLEEALELVQACGCTDEEAHKLVDYVFGREVGERSQEVGGVMVTLAALCLAQDMDMQACAETELARITKPEVVIRIREKQKRKPSMSPLPGAYPERDPYPSADGSDDALAAAPQAEQVVEDERAELVALRAEKARGFIPEGLWRKGCPPHPYGSEWFIAKLDNGQRVVLTELPEEFSYDYKTADETYYTAHRVAKWMQFQDSGYTAPPTPDVSGLVDLIDDCRGAVIDARNNASCDANYLLWEQILCRVDAALATHRSNSHE